MKSTGQHKTHKFKDQNLLCDVPGCGRHFQSPQALFGHRRMIHGIHDKTIPDPGIGKDQASPEAIKNLESEVKRLELEKKKRQLTAELPSISARPLDIMEQAGLGSLEGEAKTLAQTRALGVRDQGPAQTWLEKLLSNPEGIKVAIEGLKGILGVNHGGDNMATVLKDLGFNLKDLILNATSPKQSGTLELAGLNLSGVTMTPELLVAWLGYKGKIETAQAEFESKKETNLLLSQGLEAVGRAIGSALAEGGSLGNLFPHRESISQEIIGSEPGEEIIVCPKCGMENKLPADLAPGMEIHCQGEGCEEVWHAVDAQPKPQRQVKKRQAKVEEPEPPSCNCLKCGQLIDLSGKAIGDEIKCPVCQAVMTVKSEDLPVVPEDPDPYGTKAFLHR